MYDLKQFTLRDMSACGLALRHLGVNANSMEEASSHITQYLYEHLIDPQNNVKSVALLRFFKTHSYSELTPDLKRYVQSRLGENKPDDSLHCLTLLATAGALPEWNDRHRSVRYQAVPLLNEAAIRQLPMMSQLLQQLGIHPGAVVKIDPKLVADLEPRMYNVFYVKDALNSPYIPAQANFVIPFGVKSVIGLGGLLPSGSVFFVLMFLKITVSQDIVDLLRPLALNIKMAILPFDDQRIFSDAEPLTLNPPSEAQRAETLKSQLSTLSQLLDVSETSTLTQSDRLEAAIAQAQSALNQLKLTQTQLIQTEKMSSLGQMVAGVAHEINNPVAFIYGNLSHLQAYAAEILHILQLYQGYYPEPIPEIQQAAEAADLDFIQTDFLKILGSMQIGTERIREIVLSLRNFSRLDEAEFKAADIHQGIESTLLILNHRLKPIHNRSEIQIVRDYATLPEIACLAGQLNQVLMNILSNAIDAIEAIETSLKPQITIRTTLNDHWAEIAISDNGIGIPDAVRAKIFDPFFTTKPVGKGTGMGMSISYHIIVEKHRGKLECFSTEGQGTQFLIQIPIDQP